jgi:glycosyltransferase involved in cell wall biosynthesis
MAKVLIDATLINRRNTGLANVMQSLVRGIGCSAQSTLTYDILVPHNYVATQDIITGDQINFIPVRKWQKYIPFSLPKVDVWHSTYQCFRYLRKSAQTRQVITIHDLNFLYEKSTSKARRRLHTLQRKVDQADAIVAISQFVADDIQQHLNLHEKPLQVIYNSVESLRQSPAVKPAFLAEEERFFFSLGALRKKKNIHVLLEVMARLPEYKLVIAGNLDSQDYLAQLNQRIAELKLKNVHIAGPVSPAEKVWLYQHAEALLFPSLFEGFGLPVIEAMQFGTPVFTSNKSSLPEVGGGHSIIWEHFDPDYMTETLRNNIQILQQDVVRREQMKSYAASFSLENNIQRHMSLYQRLAVESTKEA